LRLPTPSSELRTAAPSKQELDSRGRTALLGDELPVALINGRGEQRKDKRLALEAAGGAGTPMPFASVLKDNFLDARVQDDSDVDWRALAKVAAPGRGKTNLCVRRKPLKSVADG
jgi:hypothetical protein